MSENECISSDALELMPCPFCGGEPQVTEALNEVWVRCSQCNSSNGLSTADEARAIAAWNRRPSGWISVKDRLPEEWEEILVWDGKRRNTGYRFTHSSGATHWTIGGTTASPDILKPPTHWQPLPPPPEE